MIHDFRASGALDLPRQATVVVGSGPAGLAVALTLADTGERVIVLESGDDSRARQLSADAARLNEALQTGLPLDGVVNGRSRLLGGTAALWHGQCMRLHEIDMARRDWVSGSGWPISPAELGAFYGEAEEFLDVSGRGYGPERWAEHRRLPPLAWDAERLLHDFTEYTPRPHLGKVYRPRLLTHPSLDLVVNATVRRILVQDDRAVAVEVAAPGREAVPIEARRIVLAGGAIENARLLMLSDGCGVGVGTGRAHVGRYYQDHPIIRTARIVPLDFRVLQDRYIALHSKGRRLFPKLRLAPAVQQSHQLLDATAVFVHVHEDPAREALRRLIAAARYQRLPEHPLRDVARSLGAPVTLLRDAWRRYGKGLATGRQPAAVYLQLWIEQAPDPDSRVTLADSLDSLGLRQAKLHWKCSDLELRTSREMTRWVGADLVRLGLGEMQELPVMGDDACWRASVGDAAHPAGTTRMSLDPRDGVVDTNLQVHGVRGLYVAGSSVFPTCGYANPTLTIVALSLRLGRHLSATTSP